MIFNGEIAICPATSPTLHLPSGKTDQHRRLFVSQGGLLMKEQNETKALHGLD
jgi:hypothetical protein